VRVLLCAAIVAALVSFIACTSPAADTNEVTPAGTTGATDASAGAKTGSTTVSVNLSSPQGDSRAISVSAGSALLDYYEIYFRRTDWSGTGTTADGVATLSPSEIFFGSGKPGGRAATISLEGIAPGADGTAFDILLLGGKQATADTNRILTAVAYEGSKAIKLGVTNSITLSPSFFGVFVNLFANDGTANDDMGGTWMSSPQGYVGFDVPDDDSITYYPGLSVNSAMTPLITAGFATAALSSTSGLNWLANGSYGLRTVGSPSWKTGASGATFSTSFSAPLTRIVAVGATGRNKILGADPVTFKYGTYVNTTKTLYLVGNTYGKLYAHLVINPFGQTHKGNRWYIQAGLNYLDLETLDPETASSATFAGGARALKFGNPDSLGRHLPDNDWAQSPETLVIEVEGIN
jgi:hypothetical protein